MTVMTEKKEETWRRHPTKDQFHELLRPTKGTVNKEPWRWAIRLWSLGYDGGFFKDAISSELNLSATHAGEKVDLQKLEFYPLRFASPDIIRQLKLRGSIFWSRRVKKFVSYHGRVDDISNTVGKSLLHYATFYVEARDLIFTGRRTVYG